MAIEVGFVGAQKMCDLVDPGGVVDQFFERRTRLVDLLQVFTFMLAGKVVTMDVTAPFVGFDVLERVEGIIAGGKFVGRERS